MSTGTLFAVFALRDGLIDAIHEVGELRDELALGEEQDFLPSHENIRRVEMILGSLVADLRPVISELDEPHVLERIKDDLPEFSGIDQKFNKGSLPEAVVTELHLCSRYLARAQQDLTASVQTISSLASVRASNELARSNRVMQRTALAIAVASLIVAVVSLITR